MRYLSFKPFFYLWANQLGFGLGTVEKTTAHVLFAAPSFELDDHMNYDLK
jgi:hypothetical protein